MDQSLWSQWTILDERGNIHPCPPRRGLPKVEIEKLLLASLPEAILALDDRRHVAFANRAAVSLLGRSESDILARPVCELIDLPPDPGAGAQDRFPAVVRLPDGAEVPVDAVACRVAADLRVLLLRPWSGRVVAPVAVEPMREVLLQAPLAVAVQRGPALEWELVNPAYRELLGGVDLVGRRLADVLPERAAMTLILRQTYEKGTPFVASELPLKVFSAGHETLETRLFSFLCQPTQDSAGKVDGVSTFALDVTEHVEARRQAESLAEERGEALRVRDELLSIASHELRTPLTPLILGIQHLRRSLSSSESATGAGDGTLAPGLEIAERQVKRLQQLVESLLDVSRIQAGQLSLELAEVELGALVEEVAERFRFVLEEAGSELALALDGPLWTLGDRSRLDQVISNLLANAVKYGNGSAIELALSRADDSAVLRIRDHGIGIEPADHQRIFGRFERAASARRLEGAGLGLWIVRELVSRHGGTVTVESSSGEGAAFVVHLPTCAEPETRGP